MTAPELPARHMPDSDALLLTTQDVAKILQCSPRHVARLEKDRLMPPAIRLRASVRWPRKAIDEWINAGCPALAV